MMPGRRAMGAAVWGGLALMMVGPAVGGCLGGGPVTVPVAAAIMAVWALLGRPSPQGGDAGQARPVLPALAGALAVASLSYGLGAALGALLSVDPTLAPRQAVVLGAALSAVGAALCQAGTRGRTDPIDAIFAWIADRLGG